MSLLAYITTIAIAIQVAHSYILLTANIDDLHSIATELVQSPASDQISNIIKRAYSEIKKIDLFPHRNMHYQQYESRPRAQDDNVFRRFMKDSDTEKTKADTEDTQSTTESKKEVKKEEEKESYFIKSINKVLESV